ncbi:hypothetical protein SPHINGOAX6_20079 [Sphingomonas sp. AX6]|nr:hypothetical protein SPHINGOAX6_20079 [Sphingomonas sp. AX6]
MLPPAEIGAAATPTGAAMADAAIVRAKKEAGEWGMLRMAYRIRADTDRAALIGRWRNSVQPFVAAAARSIQARGAPRRDTKKGLHLAVEAPF